MAEKQKQKVLFLLWYEHGKAIYSSRDLDVDVIVYLKGHMHADTDSRPNRR